MRTIRGFIIVLTIVIMDQFTKYLVTSSLGKGVPVDFIGKAIRLNYLTNKGGAFSLRTK